MNRSFTLAFLGVSRRRGALPFGSEAGARSIRWTAAGRGWQEAFVMRAHRLHLVSWLLIAALSACSKAAPQASPGQGPTRPGAMAGGDAAVARVLAMPSVQQNTDDPVFFVPLRSQPVKDAIYRALRSGQTQRWQDGKLTGYAVPSATTGANGCRAVRYTIDQRPEVPFESINACSISG
jgi:hypothetical protein